MRDVAAAAGVSVSVVSYVLNNSRPVRSDKRARVLEVMSDLGYVPNGMAQALKRTRTGLIGALLPDLTHQGYELIGRGIESAGRDAGYLMIACNASHDAEQAMEYLRALEAIRVDGLVLRWNHAQDRLPPVIQATRAPVVLVMHEPPVDGLRVDRVVSDTGLGMRLALRHLTEHGHSRIGLIGSMNSVDEGKSTRARISAFHQGMGDAGLEEDPRWVKLAVQPTADDGIRLAGEILDQDETPTALIVANVPCAIGTLRAIRARGIRVPEDLSVVVFGTPEMFALFPIDLTVIRQPYVEIGAEAARLLIERMRDNGASWSSRQVMIEPTLVPGASVGSPRTRPTLRRTR